MFIDMAMPIGPSLRVMLSVSDGLMQVSLEVLTSAWGRWLGPQRFARKLAQLERLGLVEQTGFSQEDPGRVIRLTEAGRLAEAGGRDPNASWQRAWDGRWRMVLFDVQERKRTDRIRLQRRLRRLHFGYLQDSVWISPDAVETLRKALGGFTADAALLTLMEAQPCSGESDADLVRGAWDFARINRCYDDYLEILRGGSAAMGERTRRNWLQTEWRAWHRAVRGDPLLPEVLLPHGYRGREAWERRRERMGRLVEAA
jgi:DNA-binding transcriptional regulator PaaX